MLSKYTQPASTYSTEKRGVFILLNHREIFISGDACMPTARKLDLCAAVRKCSIVYGAKGHVHWYPKGRVDEIHN
jgi:hypothetical protein